MMKNLLKLYILAAMLGIITMLPSTASAQKELNFLDLPLAKVNGVAVTARQLDHETAYLKTEMHLHNRPLPDSELIILRPQLLENLIERELLYQQAEEKQIKLRSEQIDAVISELKGRLNHHEKFDQFLANTGVTQAQLRERIRQGLMVGYLLHREVTRHIRVSDSETEAFFLQHPDYFIRPEQIRALHIFVAVKEESQRIESLLRIEALQTKLHQGANFAALALEQSDGPTKSKGGDLGYLTYNELIKPLAEAAFALQPGQMSDIVESRFGFHLIKVVDRIPPKPLSFKDVRKGILRTLRRNKENKAVEKFLAGLKTEATIEYTSRNP